MPGCTPRIFIPDELGISFQPVPSKIARPFCVPAYSVSCCESRALVFNGWTKVSAVVVYICHDSGAAGLVFESGVAAMPFRVPIHSVPLAMFMDVVLPTNGFAPAPKREKVEINSMREMENIETPISERIKRVSPTTFNLLILFWGSERREMSDT